MSWRQVNAIGAGLLLAALLLVSPAVILRVLESGSSIPAWWNSTMLAGLAGCSIGLFRCFLKRLDPRGWAGMVAAVVAVAVVTFPLVVPTELRPDAPNWIGWLLPIGGAALGIALPLVPALVSSVGLAGLTVVSHVSEVWPPTAFERIQTAVFIVVCTLMASVGFQAIRERVHAVDEAEARAIEASSRAGALAAQQQETARWDAVIHDDVLATLEAARSGHVSKANLRELAAASIGAIDRPDPTLGLMVSADSIRSRLSRSLEQPVELRLSRVAAAGHAPGAASCSSETPLAEDLPVVITVPGEVLVAIESAVTESCRNVRRHAAAGTKIVVTISVTQSELVVEVRDDGGGFDPERVSRRCMGIGVSIIGRTRAVGGDAAVKSAPGKSTTVTIRWPAAG